MTTPQATAAGALVKIEGKEYELSPPGLEDWEWLQTAMRGQRLEAARAAADSLGPLDSTLTPKELKQALAERQAIVDDLYDRAFNADILSAQGTDWMNSTSGLIRMSYRMLKPHHPSITIEQCYKWLRSQEKLLFREMWQLVNATMAVGQEDEAKKKEPEATSPPGKTGEESSQS